MNDPSRGYGPSPAQRLCFDGDDSKYKQWEIKLLSYMRIKDLRDGIDPDSDVLVSQDKKERAFAELVQFLDDRSLNLVMADANEDGKAALAILRDHYAGTSEQRILSLYTTLTTISMSTNESVTDYVIRAESAATALKNAGEIVSDRLLNAMVLKGLPPVFKPFRIYMEQQKKTVPFLEFKKAIRNFEENERASLSGQLDTIMRINHNDENSNGRLNRFASKHNSDYKNFNDQNNTLKCFTCEGKGHKYTECPSKLTKGKQYDNPKKNGGNKWCGVCKSKSHNENVCRKKKKENKLNHIRDEERNIEEKQKEHTFLMHLKAENKNGSNSTTKEKHYDKFLVDSGATSHIPNQ